MSVACCAGCGVNLPEGNVVCTFCNGPAAGATPMPLGADGTYWVAVRCVFTCRSCGHESPLDHLDVDGSVECFRCGLDQAFDPSGWSDALSHAHAVGDLAGPIPEGRHPHPWLSIDGANPFASVGVMMPSASGGGAVRVEAAPGYPVCSRCHAPLEARADGNHTAVRCMRCGETAAYGVPQAARAMAGGLRGVIAHDNRSDRPPVQLQGSVATGTVAILCARCSAPLGGVDKGERFVTCRFCGTSCRVPGRALLRALGAAAPAETWWLAFAGPAALRAELEAGDKGKRSVETARELPAPTALRLLVAVGVPVVVFAIVAVVMIAVE
jgi:hypothetical protein